MFEPLPPLTRFILQGGVDARTRAAPVWPAPFLERACRAGTAEWADRVRGCASLWLGPDDYLLLHADTGGASFWLQRLEAAIGDVPHSLVDISHRQCALAITGVHASALLSAGCPLDLDLAAFPVDMCTRTVFAKADVVLWRTGEQEFHLEVWRSFVDYVTGLLREAHLELS